MFVIVLFYRFSNKWKLIFLLFPFHVKVKNNKEGGNGDNFLCICWFLPTFCNTIKKLKGII